ncbi:hypothetical protein JNUCC42_04165 [Brevibacterium sp. JNUCC-42]|nr:hypothetical protein JNUCC42_04165 [Brevibacterium sp. JNUCC-42]
MSLIVKISIKDNKGKEAEIELQETDNLSKLVIVQNVVNLFGIDKDILETVNEFEKIGKAYSHFFDNMKQEEDQTEEKQIKEKSVHKNEEIREKMIEGFQEINSVNTLDQEPVVNSNFHETGIKIDADGRNRYRLRYECPICNEKGNHYVFENSVEARCHSCRIMMPVKAAHKDGFPNRDSYGNFYRAGDYHDYSY